MEWSGLIYDGFGFNEDDMCNAVRSESSINVQCGVEGSCDDVYLRQFL